MRGTILAAFAVATVSGCAVPPEPPQTLPPASDSAGLPAPPPEGPQAVFAGFPDRLFRSVGEACAEPGQRLVRPDAMTLRCESLPPVEATAALILEYDGTVDDLPRLVTSVSAVARGDSHLVSTDTYIRVPLRTGGIRVIRLEDAALDRAIREVLIRTGGRPL